MQIKLVWLALAMLWFAINWASDPADRLPIDDEISEIRSRICHRKILERIQGKNRCKSKPLHSIFEIEKRLQHEHDLADLAVLSDEYCQECFTIDDLKGCCKHYCLSCAAIMSHDCFRLPAK